MANISTVKGEITFDFSNTDEQVDRLELIELLKEQLEEHEAYFDEFVMDDLRSLWEERELDKVIVIPFIANGRWSYTTNLEWWQNEEYKSILKHAPNISIEILFSEFEPAGWFCGVSGADIKVDSDGNITLIMNEYEKCDLTEENLRDLGLYEYWYQTQHAGI